MNEVWVLNASPLILFPRIDRLDLLERLTTEIIVPAAVCEEVRAGNSTDESATRAVIWAATRCSSDIAVPASVEHWDLGAGESQVMAHGLAAPRWVVLDDKLARRCALAHEIPLIGSLGALLRAKTHGLLQEARPCPLCGSQREFCTRCGVA